MDSDGLGDDTELHAASHTLGNGHARGRSASSAPLLIGLVDAAQARQSLELRGDAHWRTDAEADIDLERLAEQRLAGGGMLDSVANMANSILGAGKSFGVRTHRC